MAAIVILDASNQPYISLGIRFGGIVIDKKEYVYHPAKDAFIRKDCAKYMRKKTWEQILEFIKQYDDESKNKS